MDCSGLRDDLLDVLYGEAGAETRRRTLAHLATCAACQNELASLRAVRSKLQQWKAPEVRPLLWRRSAFRPLPVLAAAAALLLVSAAALALRGSEARYEDGRLTVRLGRGTDERALLAALAEQESRHQREMAELRARLGPDAHPLTSAASTSDPVLRQMADMIRESEARQAVRIEASLSRFAERTESRRRYDLARIGAGLAYLDGKNGQQLSRTTELMGYVLEAKQKGSAR